MALYGQQHAIIAMRFACSQQIAINMNSIETTNNEPNWTQSILVAIVIMSLVQTNNRVFFFF